MREYQQIHSTTRPQEIEITNNAVYLAKNITPYQEDLGGRIIEGYEYDYIEYTKDEYLVKLAHENDKLQQQIIDTQLALVELYEGGDE